MKLQCFWKFDLKHNEEPTHKLWKYNNSSCFIALPDGFLYWRGPFMDLNNSGNSLSS